MRTPQRIFPPGTNWVTAVSELDGSYAIYRSDLLDEDLLGKHDADKLAQVLIDLFMERTSPLVM